MYAIRSYYVQNIKDKSISELNEKLAEQTKEHKQYIKAIKSELRQYHEAEKEEITFNTKKDKVIKKVNEIADKEKNSTIIGDEILKIISKYFEVSAGIAFSNDGSVFKAVKLFALEDDFKVEEFTPDEGIHGQVIKEYKPLKIDDIPEDYFTIFSGIGEAKPKFVYLLPIKINEKTSMLFELASFKDIKIIPLWKELLSERGSN